MKIILYGLMFICTIYLFLVYIVGRTTSHQIKFLSQICIVPFKDYDYKTYEEIRVTIDDKEYVIPKGFETDLASIPRLLWPIFAPHYAGFVAPAILHDYLYSLNGAISRRFADEVLYSALIAENVTKFTAYKFYLGVRLFGSDHFNNGVY